MLLVLALYHMLLQHYLPFLRQNSNLQDYALFPFSEGSLLSRELQLLILKLTKIVKLKQNKITMALLLVGF